MARKALEGVTHLQENMGLNSVSNLTSMVGAWEIRVLQLQDMLKESGNLMMGIVNGTIPLSLSPGRIGAAVNRAEFDGYKAD